MELFLYQVRQYALFAAIVVGLSLSACSDDDDDNPADGGSQAGTFTGTAITMGEGTVTPWVTLDDDGNPSALGLTITEEAMDNLPEEETSWVIDLPTQAAATVFKHVYFNWNPHGHPPQDVFDRPHFDAHFYLTTSAEREAIQPEDEGFANLPAAEFLPAGYFADRIPPDGPFIGVPAMGLHWTDPTDPAFQGNFTETFIWGSFDGKVTFLEPMVTNDFLKTNPNLTKDLVLPSSYQTSGYFPTKYSIIYDSDAGAYNISLDAMVMR